MRAKPYSTIVVRVPAELRSTLDAIAEARGEPLALMFAMRFARPLVTDVSISPGSKRLPDRTSSVEIEARLLTTNTLMNPNTMLEQALAAHRAGTASASEFKAAAEFGSIRRELTRRNHRRRAATRRSGLGANGAPARALPSRPARLRKRARRSKRWPARIKRAHWIARSPLGSQLISTLWRARLGQPRHCETMRANRSRRRHAERGNMLCASPKRRSYLSRSSANSAPTSRSRI